MTAFPIGSTVSYRHTNTRDAIHVPIIAAQNGGVVLAPNTPVRLTHDGYNYTAHVCAMENAVGVVDPFLEHPVTSATTTFWVFLKPGTTLQLTHHWDVAGVPNPAVDEEIFDDGCRGCY